MKSGLTVCSVVYNDNKSGLFDLMVRSVEKFTDEELNFIICDNGKNDLKKYKSRSNFKIIDNTKSKTRGSLQHGESLNLIFDLIETDRFAIIESDCIVLMKGWDKIWYPKNKLLSCEKNRIPGRVLYHVCFLAGSAKMLRLGDKIDFRPGKDNNRSSRSYKPHEDVGWQLHDKMKKTGKIYKLDFVDCKSGNGKYFDSSFQSDEFHDASGNVFVAHFGRGSNIAGKAVRKNFKHPAEQLKEWKLVAEDILK
jgi:hypothetical protein